MEAQPPWMVVFPRRSPAPRESGPQVVTVEEAGRRLTSPGSRARFTPTVSKAHALRKERSRALVRKEPKVPKSWGHTGPPGQPRGGQDVCVGEAKVHPI